MASTQYITADMDRWDSIEMKAYGTEGDADNLRILQAANPYIPQTDFFEAGVKIVVPVLEVAVTDNSTLLPPWKR